MRQALRAGDFLFWVAGNHLGALPVYDELAARPEGVLVVQFDAHLDVHHFRDCATEPSHGNFLLHCAGPLPKLVNVGHRELLLTAEHVGRFYHETYSAAELAVDPAPAVEGLRRACATAERVFLDVDLDVFDPAYFPAVSRPVPFGLGSSAVSATFRRRMVVENGRRADFRVRPRARPRRPQFGPCDVAFGVFAVATVREV